MEKYKSIYTEKTYKHSTNLKDVIGEKIKQVFYDEAGIVLITKNYQIDFNFFDGSIKNRGALKSIIKNLEKINTGYRITTEKGIVDIPMPKEFLIR